MCKYAIFHFTTLKHAKERNRDKACKHSLRSMFSANKSTGECPLRSSLSHFSPTGGFASLIVWGWSGVAKVLSILRHGRLPDIGLQLGKAYYPCSR